MKLVRFTKPYDFSNDGGATVTEAKPGDEIEVSDDIAKRVVNAELAELVDAEAPADADPDADPEGGKGGGEGDQAPDGSEGDGEGSELDSAIQQRDDARNQLLEASDYIGELESELQSEQVVSQKSNEALKEKNTECDELRQRIAALEGDADTKDGQGPATEASQDSTADDPAAADDGSELDDEEQDKDDEGWAEEGDGKNASPLDKVVKPDENK
jgi:hypothetical protein